MASEDHGPVEQAIASRREEINAAIDSSLPVSPPSRLYDASRHLLDAGGKRLRPVILLLVAEALAEVEPGTQPYDAFPASDGPVDMMAAAVSIEVIQSFTLIHDDIMDDDDLRRGVPAVHREYDLETAILAGDTLYSKAFEYMLQTDAPPERMVRALSLLARTCTQICEGQALDVEFENRESVSIEEYLDMIEYKTAVLYAAAAALPALLLGSSESTREALAGYGLSVGKAFQIQDDLLDLTATSERLGKRRGSDLVENKRTIITVHARQQGLDVDGLVGSDPTDADIDQAVAELESVGSIEYARDRAHGFVDDGLSNLEVLPQSRARDLLSDVAQYLVEREY